MTKQNVRSGKYYDLRLKLPPKQATSEHMYHTKNASKSMWNVINNTWQAQ